MNALVVGFSVEDTRRLSAELRAAGHHVLGAVGKQGAWTFLRAITPDVVFIPTGPDGARAREWVLEVSPGATFQEATIGAPASLAAAEPPRLEAPAATVSAQAAEPAEPPPTPEDPPPPPLPAPASRRLPRPAPEEPPQAREPHPDLVSKLAQVRFGDYHSILEVEPGGSPYAVREKRDYLARRFSPRGWPGRLNPDEIDILNEISRGIADAFLILSDAELAVRYERALAGARPVGPPPEGLPR